LEEDIFISYFSIAGTEKSVSHVNKTHNQRLWIPNALSTHAEDHVMELIMTFNKA
jgi:hypothetical protein